MKLYMVHCGYYDQDVCEGVYEQHVNYFVVANSFDEAKLKAKQLPEFKSKRMHVDGMKEIQAVDGCEVTLSVSPALQGKSVIITEKYRELGTPKPATPAN